MLTGLTKGQKGPDPGPALSRTAWVGLVMQSTQTAFWYDKAGSCFGTNQFGKLCLVFMLSGHWGVLPLKASSIK